MRTCTAMSARCSTSWATSPVRSASITRAPSNSTRGNAGLHYSKAALLRYLGDFAGAEAEFNAAIALDPDGIRGVQRARPVADADAAGQPCRRSCRQCWRARPRPPASCNCAMRSPRNRRTSAITKASFASLQRGAGDQASADALRGRDRPGIIGEDPRGLWRRRVRRPHRRGSTAPIQSSSSACPAPVPRWSSGFSAATRRSARLAS